MSAKCESCGKEYTPKCPRCYTALDTDVNAEMLEALKQSREILEQTHTGKGYDMLYICERLAMAISTMSLAIALAEGSK